MERKDIEPLLNELVPIIKSIESVEGISLGGSFSRGLGDRYADVDLIAYCQTTPSLEDRKQKIGRLGAKTLVSDKRIDMFWYGRRKVDVNYFTLSELERDIDINPKVTSDTVSYVLHAQILDEKDSVITRLKKRAESKMSIINGAEAKTMLMQLYSELDKVDVAFKRKDIIYLSNRLEKSKEKLIKLIYMLNHYPFISLKWAYREMERFGAIPKDLIKRLEKFSQLGLDQYVEKVGLLKEILIETEELGRKKFGTNFEVVKIKRLEGE